MRRFARIRGIQIPGSIDRDEFDVGMRYLQAFDDKSDPHASRSLAYGFDKLLGGKEKRAKILVVHMEGIVDFLFRNHKRHARLNGSDIEKREDAFILPDFVTRNLTIYNAGKDGWHSVLTLANTLKLT